MGNKRSLAHKIIPHFSGHSLYIEPFFGAGGMFFSKPKCKYNLLNDNDSDIYTLYRVIQERRQDLLQFVDEMPIHQHLMDYWLDNKETDPIKKSARFLFLSNLTLYGRGGTFRADPGNFKKLFASRLETTYKMLSDCMFTGVGFRRFFRMMPKDQNNSFVYCDPPYLDTGNNYEHGQWCEQDVIDLFDALEKYNGAWAMSEFDHPFLMEIAKDRGCNILILGERHNIKNKRVEILITNYKPIQPMLF